MWELRNGPERTAQSDLLNLTPATHLVAVWIHGRDDSSRGEMLIFLLHLQWKSGRPLL